MEFAIVTLFGNTAIASVASAVVAVEITFWQFHVCVCVCFILSLFRKALGTYVPPQGSNQGLDLEPASRYHTPSS